MGIYFDIIKFNFLRFLSYPFEIFAAIAIQLIDLGSIAIFWLAISRSSDANLNFTELISYFLIAGAVLDLVMANNYRLGRAIQKGAKSGALNTYLMRPVNLIPYIFASTVGEMGLSYIIAFARIIAGIAINPPTNQMSILLFPVSLFLALLVSIGLNMFLGVIALVTTEASGIKNVFTHFTRVFSGWLVPVSLFPDTLRHIIFLTPFPGLVFGPTNMLKSSSITHDMKIQMLITLIWGIVLIVSMSYLWKHTLKRYEGIGI
jgi:ABC-2 type transport system permease protein